LYLKKYDIGLNTENFSESILIPAGTGQYSNIRISISNFSPTMDLKLYLTDELGEKYLTKGKVFTEAIQARSKIEGTPQTATVPESMPSQVVITNMNVWVFKTIKFPWNL